MPRFIDRIHASGDHAKSAQTKVGFARIHQNLGSDAMKKRELLHAGIKKTGKDPAFPLASARTKNTIGHLLQKQRPA